MNISAVGQYIGTKNGLKILKTFSEENSKGIFNNYKTMLKYVDNEGNVVKTVVRDVFEKGKGKKGNISGSNWKIDSPSGHTSYDYNKQSVRKLFTSRDGNYGFEKKLSTTPDGKYVLNNAQSVQSKGGIVLDKYFDVFYGETGTLTLLHEGPVISHEPRPLFSSVSKVWNG